MAHNQERRQKNFQGRRGQRKKATEKRLKNSKKKIENSHIKPLHLLYLPASFTISRPPCSAADTHAHNLS